MLNYDNTFQNKCRNKIEAKNKNMQLNITKSSATMSHNYICQKCRSNYIVHLKRQRTCKPKLIQRTLNISCEIPCKIINTWLEENELLCVRNYKCILCIKLHDWGTIIYRGTPHHTNFIHTIYTFVLEGPWPGPSGI